LRIGEKAKGEKDNLGYFLCLCLSFLIFIPFPLLPLPSNPYKVGGNKRKAD